jgi:MYXO-CTERM domain-containing protein
MTQTRVLGIAALAAIAANAFAADSAQAHINMFGELKDRGGDQKTLPCGGAERGAGPVYTFEPGATITLGVDEFIPHPGYFRVSFDDDGTDGFKDPVSIKPLNPNRYDAGVACRPKDDSNLVDNCGKSDFCNVVSKTGGPTVLWDNLDPHIPKDYTAASRKQWSWTVKLPDVECTNCTLQIQQIMEDPISDATHGPFDGKADIYYRCVDIQLKRGAGNTPGTVTTPTPVENKGIDCRNAGNDAGTSRAAPVTGGVDAGAAPVRASVTGNGAIGLDALDEHDEHDAEAAAGGCSLATGEQGTSSAFGLLLALGALVARRRRPSA